MDEQLINYLSKILPAREENISDLEKKAKIEKIPIMEPISMHFVLQMLRLKQPINILEIGTAIGYSALRMLEAVPNASIITIEKDEQRYQEAIKNIQKQGKEEQIHVIHGDALEQLNNLQKDQLFDVIFIDAAKGQYRRFFEQSAPYLNKAGMILTDNVLFRGYVAQQELAPARFKNMVKKIDNYNEWLMHHPDFTTTIVPIGDGVAISSKK
ncbi:O-methyltransferase [Virgibacillus salexigens]|uniref:tRNA 5-hydroxyuridine methyltransferase n=1 Tax=Virgibacillus kapii TaxID=1638645 RepID=A0ABQ2D7K9_9BACI|nr:O-methyltransferase [Virgibacillus kapii]GGJ48994.1 putative O-methyltransferase YrrM [Virgibacillus kapii]